MPLQISTFNNITQFSKSLMPSSNNAVPYGNSLMSSRNKSPFDKSLPVHSDDSSSKFLKPNVIFSGCIVKKTMKLNL